MLPDTRDHGLRPCGEQRWPYYFLCRRPPDTQDHGLRPARRAEVALLFLVQEGTSRSLRGEEDKKEKEEEDEEDEAGRTLD